MLRKRREMIQRRSIRAASSANRSCRCLRCPLSARSRDREVQEWNFGDARVFSAVSRLEDRLIVATTVLCGLRSGSNRSERRRGSSELERLQEGTDVKICASHAYRIYPTFRPNDTFLRSAVEPSAHRHGARMGHSTTAGSAITVASARHAASPTRASRSGSMPTPSCWMESCYCARRSVAVAFRAGDATRVNWPIRHALEISSGTTICRSISMGTVLTSAARLASSPTMGSARPAWPSASS